MKYFAYGSNLNVQQMAQRCPDAEIVGSAYFPKWRLIFRNVASIVYTGNPDDMLPVGIWEITDACERALDRYEGFPSLYRKEIINGMMTYVMNSDTISPPSHYYYNTIYDGYINFDLDTQHLEEARGWSIHQDSRIRSAS